MTSRRRSLTLVVAFALALVPAAAAEARTLQAFTTQVTPARISLGATFHDVATLTPPIDSSTPTGYVTFDVFGPANPTCDSGDLALSIGVTFSSTNPVVTDDSGTTTATSDDFRPVRAGTYYVVAFYGGDDGFSSASTSCGDPGEMVHVAQSISVSGGGSAPPPPPVPPTPPTPPAPPGPPPPGSPPSGAPGAPGTPGFGPPPLLALGMALSTTSAQFSSTIDPNGLATTMHFEFSPILGGGATASAIAYVSRTPEQSVGADTTGHTVTFVAHDLLPNTTYHLRAVARNAAGVTLGQDATFKTPKDPPPPPPVLGKSFNAEPINGRVLFLMPRHRKGVGYVPLTEPRQLPVGTIVNTTSGVARVTTATTTARRGKLQAGNFGGGVFSLLQNRKQRGLTELGLQVTSKARQQCAATGKAQTAAKRALPKTVLSLLRARAKGKFATRGRFSSATVRGTIWTTADRCDGTLTLVKRGVVAVTDLRLRKTVLVRAGHAYLAKAP